MTNIRLTMMFLISILVIISSSNIISQDNRRAKNESAHLLEEAEALRKAEKPNEALKVLDNGLSKYPKSFELIALKFRILKSETRYDECVDLIEKNKDNIPAEYVKDVNSAKRKIMLEIIISELKQGLNDKAFKDLNDLADEGYRGFHNLMYNKNFSVLREMPGYNRILSKIEENSGIGKPAIDFNTTLRSGEKYTLSDEKGKVVLVDFWSTFCGPCIEEFSNLKSLYEKYNKDGFEIISINLDTEKEKVENFMVQNTLPWKHVYSGKGFEDNIAKLYEVSWLPSLWLVDRDGILRYYDVRGKDLRVAVTLLMNDN